VEAFLAAQLGCPLVFDGVAGVLTLEVCCCSLVAAMHHGHRDHRGEQWRFT